MNLKMRLERFNNIDIYPVISSEFCLGREPLEVLKKIADGGAKIVQLREKNIAKSEIAKLAEKFRDITLKYNMLLIINDHVDIALSADADGVHLGQDDLSVTDAKRDAEELIVGLSSHSVQEALEAEKNGADYINIGPIYATGTKSLSMQPLGPGAIAEISSQVNIPFTIMGGIKAANIPELVSCGASKIAMVTEITEADDIRSRVCELRRLISGN
jgi:thiamine-phosphate pyrophosphorylase